MFKALIIFALVVAVLVGGLLTLRSSGRAGMPSEEVLKRAAKRAREQAAAEERPRTLDRGTGAAHHSTGSWSTREASHTSRGRVKRWQSHQRFLARRCLRYTASQRMPIFSSTRIEAPLLMSTVEITRSARKSKNAASMRASAISVA